MMKQVCYRIELPISYEHAEMLISEMARQSDIADSLGLINISNFYEEKSEFFEGNCFDALIMREENEQG